MRYLNSIIHQAGGIVNEILLSLGRQPSRLGCGQKRILQVGRDRHRMNLCDCHPFRHRDLLGTCLSLPWQPRIVRSVLAAARNDSFTLFNMYQLRVKHFILQPLHILFKNL